ncbi:MAG: type I-E CRISPR-associated protein Cse2/CasB [Chloroflexi bacterium]|nr:type I-E CRISPR-associated protein Cse2/CasB [Chloroflexota bacterium]
MSSEHHFITYLESLTQADDRGALAALRRGLGQPPGTVPDMFPYVVPRLPNNAYPGSWAEQCYYLIPSLYALYPEMGDGRNLGSHFARTLQHDAEKDKAVERRFTALLAAHPQDLPIYLRQAISFLRSKEIPVNWHQLMWDILAWDKPDKLPRIQKRWANEFWRLQKQDDDKDGE